MTEAPANDPDEDRLLCALVERVSRAERDALAQLYDLTVARVHGLALGITHNEQRAEAITEEVYWQVWRQAPSFDHRRGPVIAWLSALARRGAGGPVTAPAREPTRTSPLDRVEPLPQQLLDLACRAGLSHEEIARQTRLPLRTVKVQIRRALAAVR